MHASLEKSIQTAHVWLNALIDELQIENKDQAYAIWRAVLHGLRDRLGVHEAAQLAAQLPTILRGIYYDGWNPKKVPVKDKSVETLYAEIRKALPGYPVIYTEKLVQAVFKILCAHVSAGEIEDVKACFPERLRALWPATKSAAA